MLICWGFCGSFCTLDRTLEQLKEIRSAGNEIIPVGSYNFCRVNSRFGTAEKWRDKVEEICERALIDSIEHAEQIGPFMQPDITVISPCTGNTLSKLANGISDTPVTLAAKSHLRNRRPLLIALASNDSLSTNFKNLACLIEKKNVFFVPLKQDDPVKKPSSLVCEFSLIPEAIASAAEGKQLLPLFR